MKKLFTAIVVGFAVIAGGFIFSALMAKTLYFGDQPAGLDFLAALVLYLCGVVAASAVLIIQNKDN